ncbi:MAG: VanW family protein [Anaerotignum sp.]
MEQERKRPRQQKQQRHQQKKSDGNKKPLLIAAAVVLIAVVAVFGYQQVQKGKIRDLLAAEGIYQGITINGEEVAGLSEEEAIAKLHEKYIAEVNGQIVTLQYGEGEEEQKWEIPFEDIGAGYDVEGAVKQAYLTGREGTEEERFAVGAELLKNGMDIELVYGYDEELLDAKLTEVAEEFDQEAVDSTVVRKNGKFIISDEQTGLMMDKEKTAENVAAVLETRISGEAAIVAEVTEPKVTAEDNSHVTDLIGTYYTTYTNSDKNRNNNLAVGCNYINGTVIAPGEVFSANANLGSQTAAGGYKNAGVYVNGKVEQGMAGGVCQVTSTLYNAAIMAELDIVERSPHSMTVGYVPLGRDAAVAGTYKDLKFRNNTEYPIMIEAYASGGKLVMNIYGHEVHSSSRKVEFETVYEATIDKPAEIVTKDPEMLEGERVVTSKGRTGCKVSVRKKVYEGGKLISNEWFSSSSYRAAADEVTVGTKKPETTAAETPTDVTGNTGESFGIQ